MTNLQNRVTSGQSSVFGAYDASSHMLRPRPIDPAFAGVRSAGSEWHMPQIREYETPVETSIRRSTRAQDTNHYPPTAQDPVVSAQDMTEAEMRDAVDWWYEQESEPEVGVELAATRRSDVGLLETPASRERSRSRDSIPSRAALAAPERYSMTLRDLDDGSSSQHGEEPLMDNTSATTHELRATTGHSRGGKGVAKVPPEDEESRRARSIAELRSIPGVGMFMTPGNSSSSNEAIPGSGMRQFFYPTSEVSDSSRLEAFHTRVRLSGEREGLLVDLGAHDNLTGSEWVERVNAWLKKHHPSESIQTSKLGRTISIEGVGTNPDRCENAVRVPLHMADGESATFDAPVIPNSSVPALLGMRSLAAKRAVVDVSAKTLTFPGPGQV